MKGNLNYFVALNPTISEDIAIQDVVAELRVFVYGTLKPGGRYYQRYCGQYSPKAWPALVCGQLYDFPQLGYPAMTVGEGWVQGVVLVFSQPLSVCTAILQGLDTLEGYQADRSDVDNEYVRVQMQTFSLRRQPGQCVWGYVMDAESVRSQQGIYLPNGFWIR